MVSCHACRRCGKDRLRGGRSGLVAKVACGHSRIRHSSDLLSLKQTRTLSGPLVEIKGFGNEFHACFCSVVAIFIRQSKLSAPTVEGAPCRDYDIEPGPFLSAKTHSHQQI